MSIHLIFSGQGAQQAGMGKSLYENSSLVRELYKEAAKILGWDIMELSFDDPEEKLTETRYCQPALYVHGYCVFRTLIEEKVVDRSEIHSALGLSLGELTALAAAGVFDFATGLEIVAQRGRLMQEACEKSRGGMAALIGGSREAARELADQHDLDIANYNCPGQIVISGLFDSIQQAMAEARNYGFKIARKLNVAGAYHSRLMKPAAREFEKFLQPIAFSNPVINIYTNATGKRVGDGAEIKSALVKQITGSVHFEDNLRNAENDSGSSVFYECGPGGVLSGFVRRIDKSWTVNSISEWEDIANIRALA